MFDFTKLIGWVRDGLFEPAPTWAEYRDANHSWGTTATQLAAPLVVLSAVLVLVFGWLFGSAGGFGGFMASLVSSAVWFALGGFIASFLADKFGGTRSFAQAFAALTFSSIPLLVGNVLATLPGVGWLIGLAGAIWSIVLLWQSLPVFLNISLERRAGHFFSTLGLSIVAMLVLGALLGVLGLGGSLLGSSDFGGSSSSSVSSRSNDNGDDDIWSYGESSGSNNGSNNTSRNNSGSGDAGMFGFGREMDYLEAAGNDTYTPPIDGKLDEEQVERAVKFLGAAQRLRNESAQALEKLGGENAEPSLGDLFKGVKGLVGAGTAEMQAVKSGNGNWAEHEWVKKQLFEARIHQDLNDTTSHNYELYQDYEETLKDWL